MGLSVLWTVYAALALGWGFTRRNRPLRYAALGLLGLTVVKAFAVDFAAVQTSYRILSFLVLGVVLLLVSLAYQKLGKSAQAKLEFDRVLDQNTDKEIHPSATLALAQVLDDLGDLDGARAQLAKWPRSALIPDARQYLGSLNLKALRTKDQR